VNVAKQTNEVIVDEKVGIGDCFRTT